MLMALTGEAGIELEHGDELAVGTSEHFHGDLVAHGLPLHCLGVGEGPSIGDRGHDLSIADVPQLCRLDPGGAEVTRVGLWISNSGLTLFDRGVG